MEVSPSEALQRPLRSGTPPCSASKALPRPAVLLQFEGMRPGEILALQIPEISTESVWIRRRVYKRHRSPEDAPFPPATSFCPPRRPSCTAPGCRGYRSTAGSVVIPRGDLGRTDPPGQHLAKLHAFK